jgi:DNA-binding GntR family transcriptional regulator
MRNKTMNLSDSVYYALKNKILRCELLPGTPLKEEALSAFFNVSRTPMRKALTRLMSEGYIVKSSDRTLRIPIISVSEIRDSFCARRLLEKAAIEEAAQRATKEDIDRLEHLIWDEEEAFRMRDTILISSLDMMFHNFLGKISRNRTYEELISQLGYKIALYLALSNTLGDVINDALNEHREILKAVKAREAKAAIDAMEKHINNVENRIIYSIDKTRGKENLDK